MRLYFILVSVLILLSGCDAFTPKGESHKEVKWLNYAIKDAFAMQYPSYLSKDDSLSPKATMAFCDKTKGVFCMVIYESRDTLAFSGYDSVSLSDYIGLLKQNEDSGLKLKLLSEKKAKVNGLNAVDYFIENDLTAENNGIPMSSLLKKVVIEGDKGFFQIYVWCVSEDFEYYKNDFNKMISSFREI